MRHKLSYCGFGNSSSGSETWRAGKKLARLAALVLSGCWLLAAGVVSNGLAADPGVPDYPAPPFHPPAGHPRVYFLAKDIPNLLSNTTKAQNAQAWQAQLKNLSRGTDVRGNRHV